MGKMSEPQAPRLNFFLTHAVYRQARTYRPAAALNNDVIQTFLRYRTPCSAV